VVNKIQTYKKQQGLRETEIPEICNRLRLHCRRGRAGGNREDGDRQRQEEVEAKILKIVLINKVQLKSVKG
jgi:hypothetical protein